jgi:hypothetical protein
MVLLFSVVHAQDDDTPVSPELTEELDQLEATVREMRELPAENPVIRVFPTKDEVLAYLDASLDRELTDEYALETTQFYRAFDFVGADFDLHTTYLALMQDQVAGFYDTETKEMNTLLISGDTLGDSLPPIEQMIYSHEYTHALQDQNFDLTRMSDIEDADQSLAMLSLVEGDAMAVMQEYTFVLLDKNPGAIAQLLAFSFSGLQAMPEDTPPIMQAELTEPYLMGMEFVLDLQADGGWSAVDAAFANPPQSMEQIIHPEKYLAGDFPAEVTLTPIDAFPSDGWELLLEQTLGEFYLRQYLQTQLVPALVDRAATGWGGDRLNLYYNPVSDERAWILRFAWDTPQDETDFSGDFQNFIQMRLDDGVTTADVGGIPCWQDAGMTLAFCITTLDGDSLVASAPLAELAAVMIAAQNQN